MPGNLIPAKKGEPSRNPSGRPKKIPELEILLADVLGEEKDGMTAAEAILKKLRQMATQGNVRAIEMLLDRAYGKPTQRTEVTGRDGSPLSGSFIVEVQQTTNGDSSDTSDGENKP